LRFIKIGSFIIRPRIQYATRDIDMAILGLGDPVCPSVRSLLSSVCHTQDNDCTYRQYSFAQHSS